MDQGPWGVEDAAAAVTVHIDDGGVVVVPDQKQPQPEEAPPPPERPAPNPGDAAPVADGSGVLAEASAKARMIIAEAEERLAGARRLREEAEAEAVEIRGRMKSEATDRAQAIIVEAEERLAEARRLREEAEADAAGRAQAIIADAEQRLAEATRLQQEAQELEETARKREKASKSVAEETLRKAEEQRRRLVEQANDDVRQIHVKAEERMAEAARRLDDASLTVDRMLRTARQEAEARSAEIIDAARRRSAHLGGGRQPVSPALAEPQPEREIDLRSLESESRMAPRLSPYSKTDWGSPPSDSPEPTVIEMPKWFAPRDAGDASKEEAESEPKMSGRKRPKLPKIEDPELLADLRSLRPEPKR